MLYFKVIKDNEFIGIATSKDFRRFQKKHTLILASDEQNGQYVYCNNALYRDYWMYPLNNDIISYQEASVTPIDEEEYNILKEAIEADKIDDTLEQMEQQQQDEYQEEQQQEINDQSYEEEIVEQDIEATLEFVKNAKIKEMRAMCGKVITDGFDITLSNEDSPCHFSLSIQDQLNLLTLSSQILEGATEVIYHADNQVCKYYPANIATEIINMATQHKTYHTTYYNSLKVYIESMEDITEIFNIEYGIDIPEEYQSDTLKSLLSIISDNNITEENIETEEENNE